MIADKHSLLTKTMFSLIFTQLFPSIIKQGSTFVAKKNIIYKITEEELDPGYVITVVIFYCNIQ